MNIGIDMSRLSTHTRTGTEHYTFELLCAMARIDRSTPYTLYCNQLPAALPPLGTNFSLRSIPCPRLWTHLRLSWEMIHHPPDVLFVPSHVVPLYHPQRSVVTIHDLGYLVFPETHTALRRIDLTLSTLWCVRAAQQIIAVSHATRDALIASSHAPQEKITVVHHGVSPRFCPVRDDALIQATRKRYGIEQDYLLYMGTVQPRKNLVRLIDAWAMVIQKHTTPPITIGKQQLVIAGKKGWLTETIEQRAKAQGIANHVHFAGYVNDDDVPALLSGALAFVFPSLYEGFGMPVLEAMACGTPVLTSTTTSLPEVAGDAALLVDPRDTQAIADGIAQLIVDASLREILCERGFVRAAQFTWERCARETLVVLRGG